MKASAVVLHISDLHFGMSEGGVTLPPQRTLALNSLHRCIKNLPPEWKPTMLCITGDIGWKGSQEDYSDAEKWIKVTLEACGLGPDALLLCPGNHDLNRKAVAYTAPADFSTADKLLTSPLAASLAAPFEQYEDFCKSLLIPPYKIGDRESYLFGTRKYGGLTFVCLNSSWFAFNDKCRGHLWLGLPLLQSMAVSNQIPEDPKEARDELCVALCHHPLDWFDDAEIHQREMRPSTWSFLHSRIQVLLTGHTHDSVRAPSLLENSAWHFSGGAGYAAAAYFNNFRLLRIADTHLEFQAFELNPRDSANPWVPYEVQSVELRKGSSTPARTVAEQTGDYKDLVNKLIQRISDQKARSLKPGCNTIPNFVDLAFIRHERLAKDDRTSRIRSTDEFKLRDCINSRRVLILGDMGSGKTTAVVRSAIDLNQSSSSLAVVLPAHLIDLDELKTTGALAHLQSRFHAANGIEVNTFQWKSIISAGHSIFAFIDGIDEIERTRASNLLNQLAAATIGNANLYVICAGRTVELEGFDTSEWMTVVPAPLSDEVRTKLFIQEHIADGLPESKAHEATQNLEARLRTLPAIDNIARTPLMARMVAIEAIDGKLTQSVSTGEVLYRSFVNRLRKWNGSGLRDSGKTQDLDRALPTVDARIEVLGITILKANLAKEPLTRERFETKLADCLQQRTNSRDPAVLKQLVEYFEDCSVLSVGDRIEVTSRPVEELLLAIGTLTADTSLEQAYYHENWRTTSYCGAIARLTGNLERWIEPFTQYLASSLRQYGCLPSAYLVAECNDSRLALAWLTNLKSSGGFRPLYTLSDEWGASAYCLAKSIELASDAGFEWFYSEYLDPHIPLINYGSRIPETVFEHWAALVAISPPEKAKKLLSAIVKPHQEANTMFRIHMIPCIAALVPETFSRQPYLQHLCKLLFRSPLRSFASSQLTALHRTSERLAVNHALLASVSEQQEVSTPSAMLWLELNGNEEAPVGLLEKVVAAHGQYSFHRGYEQILKVASQRYGESNWKSHLKWKLTSNETNFNVGAIIQLRSLGFSNLKQMAPPLAHALHDGRRIDRAESILEELLAKDGDRGCRWIAHRISRCRDNFGASSGEWRVFLRLLEKYNGDKVQLLARVLPCLGGFTIPRYADLRDSFKRLVAENDDIRLFLRRNLDSFDAERFMPAAMLLLNYDTNFEVKSIERAAVFISQAHSSIHEWEEHFVGQLVGPVVLDQINEKLGTFEPGAQLFCRAILWSNKYESGDVFCNETVDNFLSVKYGSYYLKATFGNLFRTKLARTRLLLKLREGDREQRKKAGELLLEFHHASLTIEDVGRCFVAIPLSSFFGRLPSYQSIVDDAALRASIITAARELSSSEPTPAVVAFAQALDIPERWADFFLHLRQENSFGDHEEPGLWLLNLFRINEKTGNHAGACARTIVERELSGTSQKPGDDFLHWLAIYAYDFGGLDAATLSQVISKNSICRSVACGILYRLDRNSGPAETIGQGASNQRQSSKTEGLLGILFRRFFRSPSPHRDGPIRHEPKHNYSIRPHPKITTVDVIESSIPAKTKKAAAKSVEDLTNELRLACLEERDDSHDICNLIGNFSLDANALREVTTKDLKKSSQFGLIVHLCLVYLSEAALEVDDLIELLKIAPTHNQLANPCYSHVFGLAKAAANEAVSGPKRDQYLAAIRNAAKNSSSQGLFFWEQALALNYVTSDSEKIEFLEAYVNAPWHRSEYSLDRFFEFLQDLSRSSELDLAVKKIDGLLDAVRPRGEMDVKHKVDDLFLLSLSSLYLRNEITENAALALVEALRLSFDAKPTLLELLQTYADLIPRIRPGLIPSAIDFASQISPDPVIKGISRLLVKTIN